jgi:hypothetical protein
MPEKRTNQRVAKNGRMGKSPSSQTGQFVREEKRQVRGGTRRMSSAKQAAPSKARSGVVTPRRAPAKVATSRSRAAQTVERGGRAASARRTTPARSRKASRARRGAALAPTLRPLHKMAHARMAREPSR